MRQVVLDIAFIFTAIGTVAVAILAIWGDWFRTRFAGPKVKLELRDTKGNLTETKLPLPPGVNSATGGGLKKYIYYWHIKVTNTRSWSLARRVRVMCTEIKKRMPDGSFRKQPLPLPVQLTWVFPEVHDMLPDISSEDYCGLGSIGAGDKRFSLTLYFSPYNFQGWISEGQAMEVTLIAIGDNCKSDPYQVRIHWDGIWEDHPDDMSRHLMIEEAQ